MPFFMYISERDESDSIINGRRARGGAQTTKSFWKMETEREKNWKRFFLVHDAMQILHNWIFFSLTRETFFSRSTRTRSFKKCSNDSYTRITKLCNSYGDERIHIVYEQIMKKGTVEFSKNYF